MAQKFKIGDKVKWNSEAGQVSGKIINIHTEDFNYKGYTHHAKKMIRSMKLRAINPIT